MNKNPSMFFSTWTATAVLLCFVTATKTMPVLCLRSANSHGDDTQSRQIKDLEKEFQEAFTFNLFKQQQQEKVDKDSDRKLNLVPAGSRVCNREIDRVSKNTILSFLQVLYGAILPAAVLPPLILAFSEVLKYDVSVYKVCGSCEDFYTGEEGSVFCDKSAYGYDAQHSALSFIPLESSNATEPEANIDLFLKGQLRAVLSFHGLTVDAYSGPTDLFSTDFAATLVNATQGGTLTRLVLDYLPSITTLISASAGAVGIVPDFIGFGETLTSHNRTFGLQYVYQQAAMVSYKSIEALLLKSKPKKCTIFQNVVTMTGYSEGGFAAVSAASAMSSSGLRVLHDWLAVPLLDVEEAIAFTFKSYSEKLISPDKTNIFMGVQTAYAGFAGSIDTPGLSNTGVPNQTFLSSSWMQIGNSSLNAIEWLASPQPLTQMEIFSLVPPYALQLLNPAVLKLIETGETDFCRAENVEAGVNDKLCESIKQSSVYDLLAAGSSALSNSNFPTSICSSTGDSIIPPSMFPPEIFNDLVKPIQTLFGNPLSADHGTSAYLCSLAYLNSLIGRDNNGMPLTMIDPLNLPYLVVDLEQSDLEKCLAQVTCATKNEICSQTNDCCKGGKSLKCDNNVCIKCKGKQKKCKSDADCCSNTCKKTNKCK